MRDSIVIPGRVASQFEEEMKTKQKELRTAEFDLELALGELEDDWVMDEDRNGSDAVQRVRDRAKDAQDRVDRLCKQMPANVLSSDDETTDESGDLPILSAQGTQADGDDSQLTRQQREHTCSEACDNTCSQALALHQEQQIWQAALPSSQHERAHALS
jgi:hypothetical protein